MGTGLYVLLWLIHMDGRPVRPPMVRRQQRTTEGACLPGLAIVRVESDGSHPHEPTRWGRRLARSPEGHYPQWSACIATLGLQSAVAGRLLPYLLLVVGGEMTRALRYPC